MNVRFLYRVLLDVPNNSLWTTKHDSGIVFVYVAVVEIRNPKKIFHTNRRAAHDERTIHSIRFFHDIVQGVLLPVSTRALSVEIVVVQRPRESSEEVILLYPVHLKRE